MQGGHAHISSFTHVEMPFEEKPIFSYSSMQFKGAKSSLKWLYEAGIGRRWSSGLGSRSFELKAPFTFGETVKPFKTVSLFCRVRLTASHDRFSKTVQKRRFALHESMDKGDHFPWQFIAGWGAWMTELFHLRLTMHCLLAFLVARWSDHFHYQACLSHFLVTGKTKGEKQITLGLTWSFMPEMFNQKLYSFTYIHKQSIAPGTEFKALNTSFATFHTYWAPEKSSPDSNYPSLHWSESAFQALLVVGFFLSTFQCIGHSFLNLLKVWKMSLRFHKRRRFNHSINFLLPSMNCFAHPDFHLKAQKKSVEAMKTRVAKSTLRSWQRRANKTAMEKELSRIDLFTSLQVATFLYAHSQRNLSPAMAHSEMYRYSMLFYTVLFYRLV